MKNSRLWKTAPLMRMLLPFAAGIIIQFYHPLQFAALVISGCLLSAAYILFKRLSLNVLFRLPYLQGIIINALVLLIGCLITFGNNIQHHVNWYGNFIRSARAFTIKINTPLTSTSASFKAEGEVLSIVNKDGKAINTKGKLFVYLNKTAASSGIKYGDVIYTNKLPQPIKSSGNPGGFDYKTYAALQNVYYTVYLKDGEWNMVNHKSINPLKAFIYRLRERVLNVLQTTLGKNDENAVAEALLIGYTGDLDKQMTQAYSNTGVIHIIAISGMHLGLIYFLLIWILSRIPIINKSEIFKTTAILFIIWIFTFLAGANASILRSALMFTCIILANTFGKRNNIYNSLAVSAFILLCYNPFYLWDLGFELSYLSILGIVMFNKKILNAYSFKAKWVNKLWELTALNISAQLATFPLCIYYFHQFPNLFLITNLIMIPLSSLILCGELILIAIYKIKLVGPFIGKSVFSMIAIMNRSIQWFNDLPFSRTTNLYISQLSTILLYLVILSSFCWIIYKRKYLFYSALAAVLIITIINVQLQFQHTHQRKILVYNINHHTAIDFISGHQVYLLTDSSLTNDPSIYNYNIKPSRILLDDHEAKTGFINHSATINFLGHKVFVLNNKLDAASQLPSNVDFVIVTHNASVDLEEFHNKIAFRKVIFDNSNAAYKKQAWIMECNRLNIPFFDTDKQGAFILDL